MATEAQLLKHIASGRIVLRDKADGGLLRCVQAGACSTQAPNEGLHYFSQLAGNDPPEHDAVRAFTPPKLKLSVVIKRPK